MSAGVVRGLVLGAVTLLMAFAPQSAEAQAVACPSGFVAVSRFWDGPPQDSLDRVDANVDMIICLALRDDGFLVSDDRQLFSAGPRPSADGAYFPVSALTPLLSPFAYGPLSYSSVALPYSIGDVGVRGYFRSGGNYIDPYFRTTFDRSIYNNTRFSGSFSPYSGAAGSWWNTPGRWR
jgi:hypothetical protein